MKEDYESAHHVDIRQCADPKCGAIHIFAFRSDETIICQMVIDRDEMRNVIRQMDQGQLVKH